MNFFFLYLIFLFFNTKFFFCQQIPTFIFSFGTNSKNLIDFSQNLSEKEQLGYLLFLRKVKEKTFGKLIDITPRCNCIVQRRGSPNRGKVCGRKTGLNKSYCG